MMTKKEAKYQDHPNNGHDCDDCTMWRNGRCSLVEGKISPEGWCKYFKQSHRKDIDESDLHEMKMHIHRASDEGLRKYHELMKLNGGPADKAEKEMFELVAKERAKRKLLRYLPGNSLRKKKRTKALTEDASIGPFKSPHYDKKHFIVKTKEGYNTVANGQQPNEGIKHPTLSDAKWYLKRNGFELKEDAPTCAMGTSSSTQGTGPIAGFDPPLRKKKLLRRFKDVTKK